MTTPDAGSTSQPGDHDERPAAAKEASGDFVAYDRFIDNQLHTARRQVRTVDIAVGLMTLGAGTLGFFCWRRSAIIGCCPAASAPRADGWRWLVYLAGALAYCWHSTAAAVHSPHQSGLRGLRHRTQQADAEKQPDQFPAVAGQAGGLAPHVYEAIEQHAATELAQVPVEATIDRSKLIKIGYVFLGLVLVAAIYKVSSPKDPFLTVGRIVLPWADIAPPTRVTIVDVRPGNSTVMRGQRAKISAEVHGVARQQTGQARLQHRRWPDRRPSRADAGAGRRLSVRVRVARREGGDPARRRRIESLRAMRPAMSFAWRCKRRRRSSSKASTTSIPTTPAWSARRSTIKAI